MPYRIQILDKLGNKRPPDCVIAAVAEQLGMHPVSIIDRVRKYGYLWSEALTISKYARVVANHPWRRDTIPMEERKEKWQYSIIRRDNRMVLYSAYDLSFIVDWLKKEHMIISIAQLSEAIHRAKGGHGIVLGAYVLERHKLENRNA